MACQARKSSRRPKPLSLVVRTREGRYASGRFGHLRGYFTYLTLEFPKDGPDMAGCQRCNGDQPTPAPVELRRAKRYQLSAPTIFVWAPQDGISQSGDGETRDINTFGVYVLTNSLPPVGARVQLEIMLPTLTETGFGMHLQGEGVVFRREPSGSDGTGSSPAGFAASVQFYPEASATVLSHLETFGHPL